MFNLVYPSYPAVVLPLPTSNNPSIKKAIGGEMIPVVDPSGLVIGQSTRKYLHSGSKLLHPVVHLHIINHYDQIYLQKRSLSKDLLPGYWDTAVGGHVDYGEYLEEALYREAEEELGLYDFNPIYIQSYIYESDIEKELVNVFAVVGDYHLTPDNEEVSEGKWWEIGEIEENIGKSVLTPNFEQEFMKIKNQLKALL